jgi:hypothetical protein
MTRRRYRQVWIPATILATILGIALLRPTPGFAAETIIKAFGAGFGPGSVGVVDAGEDTEIAGPQAIFAGDHGEIYLLDQVNSRVLGFDAKSPGGRTRSLALPAGVEATDLVVSQGRIYVWDGKPIALETRGETLTRSISGAGTPVPPDETTESMFAQMGAELPPTTDDTTRAVTTPRKGDVGRQLVSSRGMGPVEIAVVRDKDETAATLDVRPRGHTKSAAKLKLAVRDKLGSVEFLEVDTDGRMFVLAENIPTATSEGSVTFVARFARNGALEGVHELPLTPDVALSRRFVTVSPDGDVYFLRTRKGVVDVIGVGFRPMRNAKVIDVGVRSVGFADFKGALAAVRPLTRQRVIETGNAFESVTWRLVPSAYGADPDTRCDGFNRIRRPGYLIGRAGDTVRGIPYCWGCHGSLPQIASKIERGVLAGNVCTRNNPRRDVAGVDCSAFVSAAWGLSTHFTTAAIPSIAPVIDNPWDLKPGDALNKAGSHVMLFMRFTPDKKAEVLEASPGACNGRVCRNVYPLASLLARGYEPRRFRALVD